MIFYQSPTVAMSLFCTIPKYYHLLTKL